MSKNKEFPSEFRIPIDEENWWRVAIMPCEICGEPVVMYQRGHDNGIMDNNSYTPPRVLTGALIDGDYLCQSCRGLSGLHHKKQKLEGQISDYEDKLKEIGKSIEQLYKEMKK